MADKQLGVRISEKTMEQLEARVKTINATTPEASVTVSSVVRYAIQQYTDSLQKNYVEPTLTLPFANDAAWNEQQSEMHVHYTQAELTKLREGLALIAGVLQAKEDVAPRHAAHWEALLKRVQKSIMELALENTISMYEDDYVKNNMYFRCPMCFTINPTSFQIEFDEECCSNCGEIFPVVSTTGDEVNVLKLWEDGEEVWHYSHKGMPLTENEKVHYCKTKEQYDVLSAVEAENYHGCDGCGNYYKRKTGLCRYDMEQERHICKECRAIILENVR